MQPSLEIDYIKGYDITNVWDILYMYIMKLEQRLNIKYKLLYEIIQYKYQ